MSKYRFNFRSFVSLFMSFSFLISLISGIVLYFTPRGRIAHWSNWTFFGMDKDMWAALHINSSLILLIIAAVHLYNNWTPLCKYVRKKTTSALTMRTELILSLILSLFIILGTLFNIAPFKTIIRWNFYFKDRGLTQQQHQPYQRNSRRNISSSPGSSTGNSRGNYQSTINRGQSLGEQGAGGWGRKTVEQVCVELNQDVSAGLKKLAGNGIRASKNQAIKNIAEQYSMRPVQIIEILQQ